VEIGSKIKNLRLQNNMTQEELGEKIFVTRNAVSKWEQNRGLPSFENIKLICDLFEISIDEFTGIVKPLFNIKILSNFVMVLTFIAFIIYGVQFNIYSYSMTLFIAIQLGLYILVVLFLVLLNLDQFKQRKYLVKLLKPIIISLVIQGFFGLLFEL